HRAAASGCELPGLSQHCLWRDPDPGHDLHAARPGADARGRGEAPMTLLAVEGLTKAFGGLAAVAELDYTIAAGKIHSIIGPNGAGKTTLFNLINGVYAPSAGRVLFAGEDVTRRTPAERGPRGIARTFQNLQTFFRMTALETVMVGRHLHSDPRFLPCFLGLSSARRATRAARDKAAELMDMVGLAAWRDAASDAMPYGALKRLEIARALAAEPKLLLL